MQTINIWIKLNVYVSHLVTSHSYKRIYFVGFYFFGEFFLRGGIDERASEMSNLKLSLEHKTSGEN